MLQLIIYLLPSSFIFFFLIFNNINVSENGLLYVKKFKILIQYFNTIDWISLKTNR